jgi:transposase
VNDAVTTYGEALLEADKKRLNRTSAVGLDETSFVDHRLAAKGVMLTTRAAKWVVKEIVSGQSVTHLARELRCSWDSVNRAMRVYGAALLAADTKRLKDTTAIGLDETLFVKRGPHKKKPWSTTVCDVVNHQLIDVVPTREFTQVARWPRSQPHHVKDNLTYGCLDMSHFRTHSAYTFRHLAPTVSRDQYGARIKSPAAKPAYQ